MKTKELKFEGFKQVENKSGSDKFFDFLFDRVLEDRKRLLKEKKKSSSVYNYNLGLPTKENITQ